MATLKAWANKREGVRVEITPDSAVGVRAVSPQVLAVHLNAPVPYFLSMLTYTATFPVPRHRVQKQGVAGASKNWIRDLPLVSNGAYVLSEWKFRQYMILKRNPHYWDAKNVRIKQVKLSMVEAKNTAVNLYLAGELDYSGDNGSLPAEYAPTLKDIRTSTRAHSWLSTTTF